MPRDIRAAIQAEALRFEGTPFHRGACLPGVGADCYAVLWALYRTYLGVEPWVPYGVPPEPYTCLFNGQWEWHTRAELLLDAMRLFMPALRELPWGAAQPGDILVTGRAGQPANHVSYVFPAQVVLHARWDPHRGPSAAVLMRERRSPAFDKTIRAAFVLELPEEAPDAH